MNFKGEWSKVSKKYFELSFCSDDGLKHRNEFVFFVCPCANHLTWMVLLQTSRTEQYWTKTVKCKFLGLQIVMKLQWSYLDANSCHNSSNSGQMKLTKCFNTVYKVQLYIWGKTYIYEHIEHWTYLDSSSLKLIYLLVTRT